MKMLLVEDERTCSHALASFLRKAMAWEVDIAENGTDALRVFRSEVYQVAVVDWGLPPPGPCGIEVCRALRAQSSLGIMMITGRAALPDVLLGFDAGADDYLVKPFEPSEFVARAKALGRRSSAPPAGAPRRPDASQAVLRRDRCGQSARQPVFDPHPTREHAARIPDVELRRGRARQDRQPIHRVLQPNGERLPWGRG